VAVEVWGMFPLPRRHLGIKVSVGRSERETLPHDARTSGTPDPRTHPFSLADTPISIVCHWRLLFLPRPRDDNRMLSA